MLVRQDLNFNVLWAREQTFDVDATVPKSGHGFSACTGCGLVKFRGFVDCPHTFPAPAA